MSVESNFKSSQSKSTAKNERKLQEKINQALTSRPEKSQRGRKAQNYDEYINKSTEKIETWETELAANRGNYSQTQYEALYNKMTALKSRVRKKKEKANATSQMDRTKTTFWELSKLLSKAIEPSCRKKIMDEIQLKGPQNKNKLARTNSQTSIKSLQSQNAFVDALMHFVSLD